MTVDSNPRLDPLTGKLSDVTESADMCEFSYPVTVEGCLL